MDLFAMVFPIIVSNKNYRCTRDLMNVTSSAFFSSDLSLVTLFSCVASLICTAVQREAANPKLLLEVL